jgi:glutamate/aspartate transport system substrate-binding protein
MKGKVVMKFTAARMVLLFVMTAASVAGSLAQVQAKSPTLEKVRETGKLTLGYRETSIPFAYLGADQKPIGLSLDLCAAVAARVKSELRLAKLDVAYVAVNASNRIPLLQNGTIDIECGSTTNTIDRQKQVAFSLATYVTSPRWLVAESSGISTPKDLKGKTVVITQGSLNLSVAEKVIAEDKLGVTIVQAKDHGESILMLRTGRAAAWFEDDILIAGLVANAPNPKTLKLLPNTYAVSYYGLMLPKNDAEFKGLVDGVIKAMMASGEFTKLYDKWFTSPIPPNDQNLSLPMSDAMKARVASPSDALVP